MGTCVVWTQQKRLREKVFLTKEMETFCKRIKELRMENGFTQKQLAERLKTSNSAVCDWEKGRTQPDLQMLVQIAALFGVTTDYLLGVCDD